MIKSAPYGLDVIDPCDEDADQIASKRARERVGHVTDKPYGSNESAGSRTEHEHLRQERRKRVITRKWKQMICKVPPGFLDDAALQDASFFSSFSKRTGNQPTFIFFFWESLFACASMRVHSDDPRSKLQQHRHPAFSPSNCEMLSRGPSETSKGTSNSVSAAPPSAVSCRVSSDQKCMLGSPASNPVAAGSCSIFLFVGLASAALRQYRSDESLRSWQQPFHSVPFRLIRLSDC